MGKKLVVRGVSLPSSAPVLPSIDAALAAAGTLIFIEPGHPLDESPAVAGNVYLSNLAVEQARAATGIVSAGDQGYKPILKIGTAGTVVEYSARGGLHVVPVKSAGGGASLSYVAADRSAESLLANWIDANKGHTFFAAQWGRWTRQLGVLTGGGYDLGGIAGTNSLAQFFARNSSAGEYAYPTDSRRIGQSQENVLNAGLGPYYVDGGFLSPTASGIATSMRPFRQQAFTDPAVTPAAILYGYVFEDLTLSGRTYAQASAAWRAKYERDVKTAGGRYSGDTFTNPATIA